ncbi:MAG: hypothetical protein ACTSWN_00025 [Promethearchaeota archaeon]
MTSTQKFINLIRENLPYSFRIKSGFLVFDKDGRTFLIDLYNGTLYANPTTPDDNTLERIYRNQCINCYFNGSPDVIFDCLRYLKDGFIFPEKICVVTDPESKIKLPRIQDANLKFLGINLSNLQLKILSMFVAIQEDLIGKDIQVNINAIPRGFQLKSGECPYFQNRLDMKRNLILRNIGRYIRRRRFLDLLKKFHYVLPNHHLIGVRYFNRKIEELQNQLSTLDREKL